MHLVVYQSPNTPTDLPEEPVFFPGRAHERVDLCEPVMTGELGRIEGSLAADPTVDADEVADLTSEVLLGERLGGRDRRARRRRRCIRRRLWSVGHSGRMREAFGDLADSIGTATNADLQRAHIRLQRLGAVLQEVGVAELIWHVREDPLDRRDEPLLLVRDDRDHRDVHASHPL